MVAKIFFIIACVAECVLVPLFLKYSWPEKCWKSFGYKMGCSAMFIAAGVSCMFWADNFSSFAKMILLGLIFGMLGDLFLHLITDNQIVFGVGMLAFLIGHVFYVIAYSKALNYYLPSDTVFDWRAILIALAIFGCCVLYAWKTKMHFGIALIPCILYGIVISFMVVTAIALPLKIMANGVDLEPYGPTSMAGVFLTIGLGSVLFLLSDATLAMILFGGKKNRPLKIFNIATYFTGQILIGAGILFLTSH